MDDFLIIGGGVIGLSLAYQLAGDGHRVRVIDRTEPGHEASWAGAGILPPANRSSSSDPLDQLTTLSHRLHAQWTRDLKESTGIDNGYRRCGALYIARSQAEQELLKAAAEIWRSQQVACEELNNAGLAEVEPALAAEHAGVLAAWRLPDECQLRNPRHLKALVAACSLRGVEIVSAAEAEFFVRQGSRVTHVKTPAGDFSAGNFCIATGAWTGKLGERVGLRMAVKPIRGQIALVNAGRPVLRQILNEGPRYLVPRPDGYVLIGSTEEDVGFDKRTTTAATSGLLQFALGLVPELGAAPLERSWSGLRPCTKDGLPYLGRAPDFDNLYVAAGHFRGGLHLSPATAVVLSQLMLGQTPEVDLTAFAVNRN